MASRAATETLALFDDHSSNSQEGVQIADSAFLALV
jgi:hypothetical protein